MILSSAQFACFVLGYSFLLDSTTDLRASLLEQLPTGCFKKLQHYSLNNGHG